MALALLVEVLTEELPPKSLRQLSEAFAHRLLNDLVKRQLKLREPAGTRIFATPRRLAVAIPDVEAAAENRETEITGPAVNAPAQAIAGFAKKQGVPVEALEKRATPKGEVVVARLRIKGLVLDQVLPSLVEEALKALPIPKVMRWGAGEEQFVRPVHGLMMLHGPRVIQGTVLGLPSTNRTRGHRFMSEGEFEIEDASQYEHTLLERGMVVADFAERRAQISR